MMCLKKILGIIVLSLLFSTNGYSHPGNIGPIECHTNNSKLKFHCHQKKQNNFYKNYKHIKYKEKTSLIDFFKQSQKSFLLNNFKEN